ncbi:MAG: response regulator [Candidatus Omnitrophica bacterium]|nr:response regulator [Patescibacteria group bacterium]MDD5487939.1 response regulator [Candidatus Omnitrophota bacterium]
MNNKKRLLICDDEKGIREALDLILGDDYILGFASSGDEAVQEVRNNNYDGLLLDLKMPVKNGLETLAEIRAISPDIKVIIITGYQSVETAARSVKLGAIDYITKPFDSKEVKEKVKMI